MSVELECPFCHGSGFNGLEAYKVVEPHDINPGDYCEYCAGFGTLPVLDLNLPKDGKS